MIARTLTLALLFIALLVLAIGMTSASAAAQDDTGPGTPSDFASRVDLATLGRIAVHGEGRLKSFGSHANAMMDVVSGPRKIAGQEPAFTYLDMMLRPDAYVDADVIYVKNRAVREDIAVALEAAAARRPAMGADLSERLAAFGETGLLSPRLLRDPVLQPVYRALEADLIKTAKQIDAIKSALAVMDARFLLSRLRIVPPSGGDFDRPWHRIDEVMFVPGAVAEPSSFVLLAERTAGVPDIDQTVQATIADAWRQLVHSWTAGDADGVNAAASTLSAALPTVAPSIYPDQNRLGWEQWYFAKDQLTRTWLIYMASVIFLLLSLVYRWRPALWTGIGVFTIAFAFHTFALLLRWYISGRWPNSNMFEAVTTSAWFGGCGAVIIELLVRRTPMRGLFFLGSAATSMVALMSAHFLPVYLNPNIGNMMPVLHDVWLYIHTNVIIFSYVLIFMAAVSAACYLVWRATVGGPAHARAGGAGALLLANVDARARTGGGVVNRLAAVSIGEVLDGVTMVLMELSFVMLWAGIVMGAIWADHSWGRPWGWDPKEVFALNTFVIFLMLVHVRLKVVDKGLWTAILAVIGAGVMLFNWIVINFVITGLHSYA
ncbi:MAG: cytochrome c biogenesis protein CcsA [Phycisphaerae bacterium]|nr:cytochrome c biogenesis protein CcsA [Phycisphaerae bacterium]